MGKQSREKQMRRDGLIFKDAENERAEFKSGLEKTCIFIIRWGIYAALFTPLFVSLRFFFPFVAPKTVLFRILVEIIFTAYLFLVIHDRKYRPRLNPLTISLTIFLIIFILTSFTGINFNRSFWSTNERMTGVFTMLHLYAFFIVLVGVFKKREDWEKFLASSVIAGVLLGLYVLKGDEFSTRGGGTIGNTSFMAAYLLFNVFFALILFLFYFLKKGGWPLFWQIFSGISLLITLSVFLASTARGAIASFFLGLSLLFLGYLLFSGKKILRRIALALILISVLSITSLFFINPSLIQEKIEITIRDMRSRFVVWDTGLKGFLDRPVWGWGPENFNVVFLKHFNPCMSLSECGSEVWFDRVHNVIFDILVTTGIAGFISYSSIFLVAVYGLFRIISKIVERRNVFLPLGLTVVLIAYFFQNLLVFDMINSYLLFFLTLAFAGFLMQEDKKEEPAEGRTKPINPILTSIIVILMIVVFWAGNIKPMMANYYIIKTVGSDNAQETILFFQKSLDSLMEKYEAREQFAQKLVRSGTQLTDLSPEEKQTFLSIYEIGEVEMEKSIQENYLDFRHHLFLGELYLTSYRISNNPEKIKRAEEVLAKAIELSPTNQQGYWELAEIKLAQGKIGEAPPLLVKAVELEPKVGRSHWYLAMGYKINRDYQKALEEVVVARENNYDWMQNDDNIKQVVDILRALDKDPVEFIVQFERDLVPAMLKLVEIDPQHYKAWMTLAAAYANRGIYDKAREAAVKVSEIKPDLASKVEEFLKSLPQ